MRNILLTILIVLALVFFIQNMHPVEFVLIIWSFKMIASLVIFLTLLVGILIGFLLMFPILMRHQREINQYRKRSSHLNASSGQ